MILFLEGNLVHAVDFIEENDNIFGMKVVEDAGENSLKLVKLSARDLRDGILTREDKALVTARDASSSSCTSVTRYYKSFITN